MIAFVPDWAKGDAVRNGMGHSGVRRNGDQTSMGIFHPRQSLVQMARSQCID